MQRKNLRRFRPVLELLESRLTPSGNVKASLVSGNLTVTGDAQANGITLSQAAANEITLTPDATTTINGKAAAVTVTGVTGGLTLNLGGGNDNVTLDLSGGGITINGNLSITGPSGNKTVTTNTAGTTNVLNVTGSLSAVFGSGNDTVILDQFSVGSSMTVNHADGNANVFLGVDPANLGKMFNSVGDNLIVKNVEASGAPATGSDIDALEETNVTGSVINNLGDGDSAGFGGWTSFGSLSGTPLTVGGSVGITSLTGNLAFGDFFNDGLEVVNALVAGTVTMNMGSAASSTAAFGGGASRTSTTAGAVTISGSGAGDGAVIGTSTISGNLSATLTGTGTNSIDVDAVTVNGTTTLAATQGTAAIEIDNNTAGSTFVGSVTITTGAGNDSLEINSGVGRAATTFDSTVNANLGAGNDSLELALGGQIAFLGSATFNGGTGSNSAAMTTANFTANQPTLIDI